MTPKSSSGSLGISLNAQAYHLLGVALFLAILFAIGVLLVDAALVRLLIGCSYFLVSGFIVLLLQNKSRKGRQNDDRELDSFLPLTGLPVRFSYEELRVATKGFSEKLGSGGCASVFKGMLKDGTIVAVKRLDKPSRDMKEFMAEVKSIGRIHHINLVNLIGYCADKSSQILVYEYMPNGSLDNWIFNKNHCLNWERRKSIAINIARGLAYLHQECHKSILHLDIKPENILLDHNFTAKISDFGLCELIDRDLTQTLKTIRGTPGYIAPECLHRKTTVKADIYSFGIVLLEMICGRRNTDCVSKSDAHLLRLLQRKSEEKRLLDIVDNYDEEMQNDDKEVVRMIKIAAWCLQNESSRRPSMCTVVMLLEGVVEVESNLCFNFTFALEDSILDIDHTSPPQAASVLSEPR